MAKIYIENPSTESVAYYNPYISKRIFRGGTVGAFRTSVEVEYDKVNEIIQDIKKKHSHLKVSIIDVAEELKKAFPISKLKDRVFISYSQQDRYWLDRVQTHLKVLKNMGITVNVWDDTKIKAGQEWSKEIRNALSSAKVAILLVSTDFLASEFINQQEIPLLLKAANNGAVILPLILKPCLFKEHKELSKFQAVNKPSKPLSKLSESEQDEILISLSERIRKLISN